MWRVLGNCSVAILAGGLTTLESVYAGLPTLNIFDTEEHLKAAGKQLFEKGAAENVGFFNEQSLSKLRDRLVELNDSKSQLLRMRERSKGCIDKLGSHRIYEILRKIDVN
jgi:spore coat polysaccharide biosynthesis predicted glycosyltransferase SpsG